MADVTPRLGLLKPVLGATGWGTDIRTTTDTLDSKVVSTLEFPADVPIPTSPATENDEFNDASIDGKWSWINQGSSTITEYNGCTVLANPAEGLNVRLRVQTAPSTPFTLQCKLDWLCANISYGIGGLVLHNSTHPTTPRTIFIGRDETGGMRTWMVTANNAGVTNVASFSTAGAGRYFRVDVTSTTFEPFVSHDGMAWLTHGVFTTSSYLTSGGGALTHVGFGKTTNSSANPSRLTLWWFRKT